MTKIALHFKDERGGAAVGIAGLPAQELARERVQTGGGLAGPDRAKNRHAGKESPLRDGEPFRGGAFLGACRVVHLADDNRRPVGRGRKWPAGQAGAEPETDAHPGEPDP